MMEKIREEKIELAERCLDIAQEILEDIHSLKGEASVKDLIAIFQTAVKTHRDLSNDIQGMVVPEDKGEEYKSKVDELLRRIK